MLAKIPNFEYLDMPDAEEDLTEKDTVSDTGTDEILPLYSADELVATGM